MMNTNNNDAAGWSFWVNNLPSASFTPGAGEDCDRGASLEKDSARDQENERRPLNSKSRKYNRTSWNIGEKMLIYECFVYSRHECWGRKKDLILEEQIMASENDSYWLHKIKAS